jgi:hypothetical protein
MNGQANVHAPTDENWVIAFDSGQTFVGRVQALERIFAGWTPVADAPRRLSPIYALSIQAEQIAPGQVRVHWIGAPVLLLPSFDSLDLGKSATVKSISELSPEDQAKVRQAIAIGEQQTMQLRAASSGLAIAGPETKVPPMAGGRRS